MAKPFVLALSTSAGIAQVCAVQADLASLQWATSNPLNNNSLNNNLPVLFEYEIADYKQQSAQLLPMLQSQLQALGLTGADCKALACNLGPGGFTSLRTACGVTQGLAVAWACPAYGFSSFECQAATEWLAGAATSTTHLCVVDARLQEFYVAALQNGRFVRKACQVPATQDAVDQQLADLATLQPQLLLDAAAFRVLAQGPVQRGQRVVEATARGLALLGLQALASGQQGEPTGIQPLYVREKVAQTTAERQAAKHGQP